MSLIKEYFEQVIYGFTKEANDLETIESVFIGMPILIMIAIPFWYLMDCLRS